MRLRDVPGVQAVGTCNLMYGGMGANTTFLSISHYNGLVPAM